METELEDDEHGNYLSWKGTTPTVDVRAVTFAKKLYKIRLISRLLYKVRLRLVSYQCNPVSVRLEAIVSKNYVT